MSLAVNQMKGWSMNINPLLKFVLAILLLIPSLALGQTRTRPRTPEKPTTTARPTPSEVAQKPRAVTINLKHGAPVNGNFIQADADTIQVDVAGNRLHIKLDDVTSISFAADANARVSQAPTRTTENIDQALRALRKLAGATEVGVNYEQYSALIIDAKAAVDEALATVSDEDLKSELKSSMDAYVDAGHVWDDMVSIPSSRGRVVLVTSEGPNEPIWSIHKKYASPVPAGTSVISGEELRNTVWAAARKHLDQASALVK
jgi:hypothetical protein